MKNSGAKDPAKDRTLRLEGAMTPDPYCHHEMGVQFPGLPAQQKIAKKDPPAPHPK